MASPTAPTRITPFNKELLYAPESVAMGTAGTVFTREPVRSVSTTIVRNSETQTEYMGLAAAHVGEDPMTEHAQVDVQVAARVAGLSAYGLLTMLGLASDTASGSAPTTHTGVVNTSTTSMDTWTLLHDQGDRSGGGNPQNLEQILFGSLNTYSLAFQTTGVVLANLQFLGVKPTTVAPPTITNYVGSTANYPGTRIMPSMVTFTIYNSAGSAYTAKITQGSFNLARNVSPEFAMSSGSLAAWQSSTKDPFDFVPQELMVSGGFTATFDGNASASIRQDYLSFAELGSAGHVHSIAMVVDSSNSITVNFYPIRITGGTIDNSGRVKIAATFNSYNDLGVLNASSPAITTVKSVVIKNGISTAMTT